MEKLDINIFCVAVFLTKPFLKTEYILEKVNFDYNAKIANNPIKLSLNTNLLTFKKF